MKNSFTKITQEEKNNILQQHHKVIMENFNKLLNSKHGNVKPLVVESALSPEPVIVNSFTELFLFTKEGEYKLGEKLNTFITGEVTESLEKSKKTIENFYKSSRFPLPKLIEIGVGTSSGGSSEANDVVAQKRINEAKRLIEKAMSELGYNAEMIRKFLTTNTSIKYFPTNTDANLYDRGKVKPNMMERFLYIKINTLGTKGLNPSRINDIGADMELFKGLNFDPNEEGIVKAICGLQTLSDIKELNQRLRNSGGLQTFINDTITGTGYVMGDEGERKTIVNCLNRIAGKTIAKIVDDKVALLM